MTSNQRNRNPGADPNVDARLARLEASDRSARWWRRTALAVIAAAASAPFVADALEPAPNLFADGEVISATEMNDNFSHLQNAITGVEARIAAAESRAEMAEDRLGNLEARPVIPSCGAGEVPYWSGGGWSCDDPTEIVDADALLRTKMAWGIVYHNSASSSTHCSVEESSLPGMTCSFSKGAFTIKTPGWATHYVNDVITANASWCSSCSNLGIRVDPLNNTETLILSLAGYSTGTARVNFVLLKK